MKTLEENLVNYHETKQTLENELSEINHELDEIKSKMFSYDTSAYITEEHVESLKRQYENSLENKSKFIERIDEIDEETAQTRLKVKRANDFISGFDIEMMKKKRSAQRDLERKLSELKSTHSLEKQKLLSKKKLAKKLEPCDCFTHKPDCKYMIKSNENADQIEKQQKKVVTLISKVNDLELLFEDLKEENLTDKIEKYNKIVRKKSELEVSLSSYDVELVQINAKLSTLLNDLPSIEEDYRNAKSKLENEEIEILKRYRQKLKNKKSIAQDLQDQRDKLISKIAETKVTIADIKKQKKEFDELSKQLKVYDAILQAISNKGIPLQLINVMLPSINNEISKILQGVVNFTVELEADLESNSMDIFINYGDSRRIIELGSGMEKMISSLAIRVALINVSSMSKTNSLIIDEGFGSLDELNLEACSRLLQSLKKWFKNIVVISHVDVIKDAVDNTIDIMKKGIDSYVSNE